MAVRRREKEGVFSTSVGHQVSLLLKFSEINLFFDKILCNYPISFPKWNPSLYESIYLFY